MLINSYSHLYNFYSSTRHVSYCTQLVVDSRKIVMTYHSQMTVLTIREENISNLIILYSGHPWIHVKCIPCKALPFFFQTIVTLLYFWSQIYIFLIFYDQNIFRADILMYLSSIECAPNYLIHFLDPVPGQSISVHKSFTDIKWQ